MNGISDMHFTTYVAHGADHIGDPEDTDETGRVDWLPIDDLLKLIASGLTR
jgi:8-oxo-dGTP pyrophosphatase MutT (NUDIX family)